MIGRQYEHIKEHVQRQICLISKKLLNSPNSRELTNKEIELLLFKTINEKPRERSYQEERVIEELHARLATLTKYEIELVTYRFTDCLTTRQIAKKVNRSPMHVSRNLRRILNTLKRS